MRPLRSLRSLGSPRTSPRRRHRGAPAVPVVVCALALVAGPALAPAQPAHAQPGPGTSAKTDLEEIRKKIERLHDRAGSATDAYNAAAEKAKKQQKSVDRINRRIETTQGELDRFTDTAGALARAQYRSGGLPDAARLVLDSDPENFLHKASLARKGQQATRGVISGLARTRAELKRDGKKANSVWKELEENRKKKAAAKKKIEGRLKEAKEIESRLKKKERERLRKLERDAAQQRQAKWLDSGAWKDVDGKASKAGKRAIAYATEQLGKDYVWGAEGPDTFDCSGLTMRAWQAAGEAIPRTSQEQWRQLPHVPVARMRPGDLIIYKRDASHVGLYVGDGKLLHAPRTGRQITVEGAGTMPILGVVRPDK
ncbi:C40 family peptidase [Streptomyces cacaoi]|uniref:C40 family peptidase n=1 Tax=Streptomyces cacaoi TaxID=1898 RepID=UPI00332A8BE2